MDIISTIFPEIEKINDQKIRRGVKETWDRALQIGGWNYEDLDRMPFVVKELKNCPVTLAQHTRMVAQVAYALCQYLTSAYRDYLKINQDYVIAGAILHDVGKVLEYKIENGKLVITREGELFRHPISGAALAAQCGLPVEICHIISVHSFEGTNSYKSPEAFLVITADQVNFGFLQYVFSR